MRSPAPRLPDVEIFGVNKHIRIAHPFGATWCHSFYVLHPLSLPLLRNVLEFYTNTHKLFFREENYGKRERQAKD